MRRLVKPKIKKQRWVFIAGKMQGVEKQKPFIVGLMQRTNNTV